MAKLYHRVDLATSRNLLLQRYQGCDVLAYYTDETGKARLGVLDQGTANAMLASDLTELAPPDLSFTDYRAIVEEGRTGA